ncbi:MAG: glycosyltransferase [Chloroflexi bacterium]|nr:glycosyltransferase [Chloroflexota bacterium]
MRIAMVTTHPPSKGSLNEYAYHFVRFLRLKVESVTELILLVDELPEGQVFMLADETGSIPVRLIPCWKFGAINNALRIRAAVRQVNPDIVLFNIQFASFADKKIPATLGLLTPWLVKKAGYTVVVLLHNIVETVNLKSAGFGGNPVIEAAIRWFGNIVTRFLLASDLVAVTIPKYVEILEGKYGAKNVILAPHGSFEEPTNIQPNTMPAGPPNIMTFGKFGTYKKVEILAQAFEMLLPAHPGARLVIAGTDSPNVKGYLDGVKAQFAHVPDIYFSGYVSEEDVPRIFGDAWVVVFPYTSTTGSSGVLHQAGGYGKAVVLPNLGDLAELVLEEGYDGEFFEPTDVKSLADAICRVIDYPERQLEIGSCNFLAANGLPISDVVDWYIIHFQQLLKRK